VIGLGSTIVLALSLAVTTLVLRTVPAAGADASVERQAPPEPIPVAPYVGLPQRLRDAGYVLPARVSVYAAQIVVGTDGTLDLVEYQAGAGALDEDFWPASSVKVLAALGALDFLRSEGFTGAASIQASTGWSATVRELADAALDESSNAAYDQLVQIAGLERLNNSFLTAANGFPDTVIQRSYAGIDIRSSPTLVLRERGRTMTVPARTTAKDYGCPANGNCSNLQELTDSVRRVVLDPELAPVDRLGLDPTDLELLGDALLASEGWFDPGVARVLGTGARVYNKPGVAPGRDCVDVGLIDDPATGGRYLLGVSSPVASSPDCALLAKVAEEVLGALLPEPR